MGGHARYVMIIIREPGLRLLLYDMDVPGSQQARCMLQVSVYREEHVYVILNTMCCSLLDSKTTCQELWTAVTLRTHLSMLECRNTESIHLQALIQS